MPLDMFWTTVDSDCILSRHFSGPWHVPPWWVSNIPANSLLGRAQPWPCGHCGHWVGERLGSHCHCNGPCRPNTTPWGFPSPWGFAFLHGGSSCPDFCPNFSSCDLSLLALTIAVTLAFGSPLAFPLAFALAFELLPGFFWSGCSESAFSASAAPAAFSQPHCTSQSNSPECCLERWKPSALATWVGPHLPWVAWKPLALLLSRLQPEAGLAKQAVLALAV